MFARAGWMWVASVWIGMTAACPITRAFQDLQASILHHEKVNIPTPRVLNLSLEVHDQLDHAEGIQ